MKKIYQDIMWIIATGVGVAMVAFMAVFIPLVGLIIVCIPVPFAVLMEKRGQWQGIIAIILTATIYGLLIHLYVGMAFLFIIPIALFLLYLLKLDNATYEKIAFLSVTTILSFIGATALMTQLLGQNPIEYLTETMISFVSQHSEMLKELFSIYVQMGLIEKTLTQEELIKLLKVTMQETIVYVPIIIISLSFISSSVNLTTCRSLLRKIKKQEKIPALSAFSDWVLPKGTSAGFLLLFVLSFLVMGINRSVGTAVFTTVSSLFVFIFSVQGLSVADCFMKYKGLNQFIRVIALGLILVIFNMILYILGILEQFINLRKKIQQNSHVV